MQLAVGAGEIDEVERVADDAFDPASLRRPRKRAICSLECSVGLHIRGLWVKTCTASQPSSSARSIAVEIPPAEET